VPVDALAGIPVAPAVVRTAVPAVRTGGTAVGMAAAAAASTGLVEGQVAPGADAESRKVMGPAESIGVAVAAADLGGSEAQAAFAWVTAPEFAGAVEAQGSDLVDTEAPISAVQRSWADSDAAPARPCRAQCPLVAASLLLVLVEVGLVVLSGTRPP
jgi:hypothetical protein